MLRRAVAPATVATTAQARSIYEYKYGQTPLTTAFNVPMGQRQPFKAEPPTVAPVTVEKVRITKLHNGARVISHNLGGPMVSVGAYVLAGPAYDPTGCPGVGSMMHLALTTSNYNNSLFQLDRNLRALGAAESHFEKYKHYIGLRVDCRGDKWRSQVPDVNSRSKIQGDNKDQHFDVNLMQDNLFTGLAAPRFHETDIERFRDTIDNQVKELKWLYPAEYAKQMLETVAFYREPLGSPRFVPENNNGNITSQVLLDHYSRYVLPSRTVIAGVNVDHDALIAEYENTPFPHSEKAPHHAKVAAEKLTEIDVSSEKKQYTGGERHDHEERAKDMGTKPDMDPETICAVGFLAFGRTKTVLKEYAASLVLKNLIDLQLHDGVRYQKDETHVHEGLRAFYNPYETAGLIGFTATAEPQHAVKMVGDTVTMIQGMKSVAQSAVDAAKQRATTQFLNEHTDNVRDYCDFLGTSFPIINAAATPTSVEEIVAVIQSVTAANVTRVLDCMFSNPTALYGHGEMLHFPSLRQMGL